jgi:hypothetical protein
MKLNTIGAGGFILSGTGVSMAWGAASEKGQSMFDVKRLLGDLKKVNGPAYLESATWYEARSPGDGLEFTFPKGALAQTQYLYSDMLLDGKDLCTFNLRLQEGEHGPVFSLAYGLISQCSARMRMPLSLVDMNKWRIDREGAWLKPQCYGDRVNLEKVDRVKLVVVRKSDVPVRWCMTDLSASDKEVPLLSEPVLPKGTLLDEMGQSTQHEWPGKSMSAEAVTDALKKQLKDAPGQQWPASFSRWGGWKEKQFEATGFFGTKFDGKRWWLVDPEGYAFWSAGLNCVRVDVDAHVAGIESALAFRPDPDGPYKDMYGRRGKSMTYLAGNFIRAFGPETWREKWGTIALSQLRAMRFNTVANWSEWKTAREDAFPYVRAMSFRPRNLKMIYRDFPDVFDPGFESAAIDYAQTLAQTADDPALIGYFMMNEPTWAFSSELPAYGMLLNTAECATRKTLAAFLKKRYSGTDAFGAAWGDGATFSGVAQGDWELPINDQAMDDLEAFTEVMVTRFFTTLAAACKKVDPKHLNLGIRYYQPPPSWAMEGMKTFDVFSMNCYKEKIPDDEVKQIHDMLKMPVMIGEWHFGALDVGLPASGIGHVRTQEDRGKAYRYYVEDAAANPYCVGAHWFTLYDQSALGRFDGENYNIGFLDVCNRPHEGICDAARMSHEAMYKIADGRQKAFDDAPEYLERLFL